MAIAWLLLESRRNIISLLTEPWLYAIVAVFVFQRLDVATAQVDRILSPLAHAAYPVLLLLLGTGLYPLSSVKSPDAWATVGIRLVTGLGVALLAVAILPLSSAVAEAVVLTSLAPPATQSMVLSGQGPDTEASQAASAVGTLVSLVVLATMMATGWKPWHM